MLATTSYTSRKMTCCRLESYNSSEVARSLFGLRVVSDFGKKIGDRAKYTRRSRLGEHSTQVELRVSCVYVYFATRPSVTKIRDYLQPKADKVNFYPFRGCFHDTGMNFVPECSSYCIHMAKLTVSFLSCMNFFFLHRKQRWCKFRGTCYCAY